MKKRWLIGAALVGSAAGAALVKKLWLAKYREQSAILANAERERDLLYTWILLKEKGVELTEFFAAHSMKMMSILGMDRIGRRLYDDLQGRDGLNVVYGVEAERFGAVHETLTVYRLGDDPLPPADCMVVCDTQWDADKARTARREFSGRIVSLTEVMAWLLEEHHVEPRDGAIDGWPHEDQR